MIQNLAAVPFLNPAPLTALVVSCNESRRLADCLQALSFCAERIVIDLQSEDECAAIAAREGARVVTHPRVPIVEQVRPHAVSLAAHDWVIFVDPDEVVPESIGRRVAQIVASDADAGMIWLPCRIHFRGKPVRTSYWGALDGKPMVFHRRRVRFSTLVHRGFELLPPYGEQRLDQLRDGAVEHYWADSYAHVIEKHQRYILHEGESLYAAGERFSWVTAIRKVSGALADDLFRLGGVRGGWTGIFLSCFHAWYLLGSLRSLRSHQRSLEDRGRREE